ncbi:MAG: hypothetical protein HOO93_13760 [Methyloglobulus sp.]|nr:hypothetical protein [Methyloglobulus sp.]
MLILAVMIIRILPAILNFFLLKIVTVRITTAVFQKLVDKFFSLLIRHSRLRNDSGLSGLIFKKDLEAENRHSINQKSRLKLLREKHSHSVRFLMIIAHLRV